MIGTDRGPHPLTIGFAPVWGMICVLDIHPDWRVPRIDGSDAKCFRQDFSVDWFPQVLCNTCPFPSKYKIVGKQIRQREEDPKAACMQPDN